MTKSSVSFEMPESDLSFSSEWETAYSPGCLTYCFLYSGGDKHDSEMYEGNDGNMQVFYLKKQ